MVEMVLAPYQWAVDDSGSSRWEPPGGNHVGAVDLRSFAQRTALGGPPGGFGLFVYRDGQSPPGGRALGRSLDRELVPTDRAALRAMLELPELPPAETVRMSLWRLLTEYGDPTGVARAKPLMPTINGRLELHLGGFSLIRDEAFNLSTHPHRGQVLAVVREGYRQSRSHCLMTYPVGHPLRGSYLRHLDWLCRKYRVRNHALFLEGVPNEGRLPMGTTITEEFNQADSSTLGPTLTWTEVDGDWSTISNEVNLITTGGTGPRTARAESNLAGDDHYCQLNKTVAGTDSTGVFFGAACRFAAAAETAYYSKLRSNTAGNDHQSERVEAGATTAVGADTNDGNTGTTKIQADGSTIKRFFNGAEVDSATDTAITANTLCGIIGRVNGANNLKGDSWEAADLAVGSLPFLTQSESARAMLARF